MGVQVDRYPHAGNEQGIEEGVDMEFYSYLNIFETKGLGVSFVDIVSRFNLAVNQVPLVPGKKD